MQKRSQADSIRSPDESWCRSRWAAGWRSAAVISARSGYRSWAASRHSA